MAVRSSSARAGDVRAGPATPILEAAGLCKHFRIGGLASRRWLHAVDDVDLAIGEREIVALVGESGSGKSTLARLLAMLHRPTGGEIRFHGRSLGRVRGRGDVLAYRRRVQMVFQDPYSSLNPVYPASHGVVRALALHRPEIDRRTRTAYAERILESVGLTPPGELMRSYPYELSGGQRQRFGIAQALACGPEMILADEPVSMLDVSIRIGVLNLIADLRSREGVSFLYITHDIGSARYIADRLLVMYAGHVVETGPVDDVLEHPRHPYTQLLLSAVPDPGAPLETLPPTDAGEPPRLVDPGAGCRFRARCPYAVQDCAEVTPRLRPMRPDHAAACHVARSEVLDDG